MPRHILAVAFFVVFVGCCLALGRAKRAARRDEEAAP